MQEAGRGRSSPFFSLLLFNSVGVWKSCCCCGRMPSPRALRLELSASISLSCWVCAPPAPLECEVSPSAPAAVPAATGKAKTTLGQILTWNSHFFSHFSLQVLPSEHFLVVCFGSVICFQVLQDAQLIWKKCFPHTCKIFQWDSENLFVFVII